MAEIIDEDNLLSKEGLYIELSTDGKIKRHLKANGKEIPLRDTTIAEELIQLTEQTFDYLSAVSIRLLESLEEVDKEPDGFAKYKEYMSTVLYEMETTDVVSGTLTRTMLTDMEDEAVVNGWEGADHVWETLKRLNWVTTVQCGVTNIFDDLCEGVETEFGMDDIRHIAVTQILTLESRIIPQYFFRTEENYYLFLLQHYLASRPNIAKCQLCGKFFLPKTRKKTLYCDRVIENGKTCKQIAPRLKHKALAADDWVVKEFDRIKKMQYIRYQRTGPDKKPSVIDITLPEYWAWLESATNAINHYLIGEISQNEAFAIFHVPKKQDMIQDNIAERTVTNPDSKHKYPIRY